eukprot:scaffold32514_cov57-Cyclotella_meneghiniana.AAC.2
MSEGRRASRAVMKLFKSANQEEVQRYSTGAYRSQKNGVPVEQMLPNPENLSGYNKKELQFFDLHDPPDNVNSIF